MAQPVRLEVSLRAHLGGNRICRFAVEILPTTIDELMKCWLIHKCGCEEVAAAVEAMAPVQGVAAMGGFSGYTLVVQEGWLVACGLKGSNIQPHAPD